jgi:uncharacterized repeat protein (TIGR01451 family)
MTAWRGTLAIVSACLFAGTVTIKGERPRHLPTRTFSHQPLSFEANRGQADPRVQFIARGAAYSIGLTPTAADLVLRPASDTDAAATVRMSLAGARGGSRGTGVDELPGKINYFLGNDSTKWVTNVPTYARVEYADVYPGVDLVYYGNQRELEYDFIVAPGADPRRIALAFDGAEGIELDGNRDLRLHVPGGAGDIRLHTPVVYQEIDGRRVSVDSAFRIAKGAPSRIGIDVGGYDETRPLVIDPILSYSTYLGADHSDWATAVAADSAGNAYVTGYTRPNSLPFPVTAGAFQTTLQGECCVAFVTKFSPTGGIVYSTYLGGAGAQYGSTAGYGIAVDSDGNAYITGNTGSGLFPTVHPIQPGCGGAPAYSACAYSDAFVTKLNPTGSALIYSTFVGGYGNDYGYGIAIDPAGNAYIVGQTWTSDFPSVHALQSFTGGAYAFVVKVNPAGSAFVYATPLGAGSEYGWAIAADASGNAYVTGQTYAGVVFPTTPGAVQVSTGGGTWDAFVTKINATGSALVYSTYLGGLGDDVGRGIAVDADGHAYVSGQTCSANFPTANPLQAANHSSCNAFISKLNTAGSALVYSTYLGGLGGENATSIAVDGAGNAFVAGYGGGDLPLVDPVQTTTPGGYEGFVAKLNAAGSALAYSTYLGGSGNDYIHGIAIDSAGSAYVAGETNSLDFPTVNAIQPDDRHDQFTAAFSTAFVAKIESPGADVAITKTGPVNPVIVGQTLTYTITASNNGPVAATGVKVTDVLPAGVTFVSAAPSAGSCSGTSTITCTIGALANGGSATITIAVTPTSVGAVTNTASISADQFDAVGGNNSATIVTTVNAPPDTTPPTLVLPGNQTLEATSAAGAIATFTVSAADDENPSPAVSCDAASGSTFPLGTTTVHCSADDGHGNTAAGSFLIQVVDTTSPVVSVPAALTREATSAAGAVVTFIASAIDLVDGGDAVVCVPASGSTFAIGSTTVHCSATDAAGNTTTAAFTVMVVSAPPPPGGPVPALQAIAGKVNALTSAGVLNKGQANSLVAKLQAAIQQIEKGNSKPASNQLAAFVNEVNALMKARTLSQAQGTDLINDANAVIAQL